MATPRSCTEPRYCVPDRAARGERRHFTIRGTSIADERLGEYPASINSAEHVVILCDLPESELAGHEIAFDSRETSSSGVR
jgi:hypothetical protein